MLLHQMTGRQNRNKTSKKATPDERNEVITNSQLLRNFIKLTNEKKTAYSYELETILYNYRVGEIVKISLFLLGKRTKLTRQGRLTIRGDGGSGSSSVERNYNINTAYKNLFIRRNARLVVPYTLHMICGKAGPFRHTAVQLHSHLAQI